MSKRWKNHRPLFSAPAYGPARRRPFYKRALPIAWQALKRACMVVGGLVLFSALMGTIATMSVVNKGPPSLPGNMVLYLDFSEGLRELPPEASFIDPFATVPPTLRELVEALDRARSDDRVHGIYARLDGGAFSLAHVQELRKAVRRFRESGKFAYIYSPSYGEGGNGLGGFYLATAFDEIWMQTMGVVSISGLSAQIPFFREVLDEIGVYPNFFQRKEYKSAYESLTNKEMSPASREETTQLIADMRAELLRDIPPALDMSALKFTQLVDKGLFTAGEAVAAGLVTQASYADILVENIRARVTGDPQSEDEIFVDARSYAADIQKQKNKRNSPAEAKPEVALVYVVGTIMSTGAGGGIAAADKIAPAILEAGDDENIEAIIVRVDSPGGSPSASESILRAIEKAQRKGKPVIVSMGSAAASGGYWVSAYADTIFALPTTITGSIGVVGGKIAVGALWEKLGVNWESVNWGRNAEMWSINRPFSESEAERINAMLDQVYDGFVKRVSWGRNMTEAQVDKIAGGRVWSGAQAAKIGLVDELGGLSDAMDFTAQLLGMTGKGDIDVIVMPRPKNAFEQLIELLEQQGGMIHAMQNFKAAMDFFGPAAREMAVIRNAEPVMAYQPLQVQ